MAIQTYSSGQILTAASMTSLQQQAVMTFTTEAARDAALTAPTEGMFAYLTAPTVPAATGEFTKIPSGILTIYNGTNWTCITPVSAETTTGGTTTSGTFTPTLTSGGTNPSVTLTTGTTAIVSIRARGGGPGTAGFSFYQVAPAVSGATTLAANERWGITSGNTATAPSGFGATFIMTGLTAGTNTFTLNYVGNSGTASFSFREIIVAGCL
jgi:hypothetical protein